MTGALRRRTAQTGVALVLAISALICLIPLLGLVVDVGFLYGAKAHLQASVDGAALAGARAIVLDIAADTTATNTKNNAATWFYANFPTGTWGTANTTMTKATDVQVYQDCSPPSPAVAPSPCNLNLWHVDVTANTQVPTYFMKWFGSSVTTINATGKATRRNVAAMLVLDRSGSMCAGGSQPCGKAQSSLACAAMINAAKLFVGQFANGRDYIGMVTFNNGVWVTQPTQNFRATLGYTDAMGNSNASNLALDNIQCRNGTGTAAALSVAYNELYKLGMQGALNVILLETDGLPNTMTMKWWDGANSGLRSGSACQDTNNLTPGGGGWTTAASQRTWVPTTSNAYSTVFSSGTYYTAPTGPYGAFYTDDPASGSTFREMYSPWSTSDTAAEITLNSTATASGCSFGGTAYSPGSGEVAWWPTTDLFGANLAPATCSQGATGPCAYNKNGAITMTGGHVSVSTWANAKNAVYNAVDNAAYRIRADTTLKPTIYTIGLAGNSGDPPDTTLLQRIANDPDGDPTNGIYPCNDTVHNPNCITFSAQQKGQFVYSSNASALRQAFLSLASQMLRLAK